MGAADAGGSRAGTGQVEVAVRILVVSNFYPPQFIGGYELACHDAVEALATRGHEVRVLTSTYGIGRRQHRDNVWRWLQTDLGWRVEDFPHYLFNTIRREVVDQRAFKLFCRSFKPHIVYVWNLRHLSLSLCLSAQRFGLPVCYFVFDYWISGIEKDPWYSLTKHRPRRLYRRLCWAAARSLLGSAGILVQELPIDLSHVQFASQHLKKDALLAGKRVAGAEVIHWGLDLKRYPFKTTPSQGAKLLYVGQVAPHKGVHTAIEALSILHRDYALDGATLTIVGGTIFPDYANELRRLVTRLGLDGHIRFRGPYSREELPTIYADHDVLLFPSVWDEPFGITLLEGMAIGIPVVATATGGAAEIVQDEINALLFPKDDAEGCAKSVKRLLEDRGLLERIRTGGRARVEQRFRLEQAIDRIQESLSAAAHSRPACYVGGSR